MDKQIKILLCGDVEGNFNTLIKRTETIINKSGQFELMLCVGSFFGKDDEEIIPYRNGTKKVPVLTYVLGPNNEDSCKFYPDDGELCPNVYYLGKRGLYTSTGGLKIAYISGTACNSSTKYDWNFTDEDIKSLRDVCLRGNSNFRGIDILLSSQWPSNVMNYDDGSKGKPAATSASDKISWLAMQLKPRYHVSGLEGIHYERVPYRTSDEADLEIVTRFIGLGKVANVKKEKWIHALCLTPIDKMSISQLIQKTTDETPCPYNGAELEVFGKKRPRDLGQYFYDINSGPEVNKRKSGKKQRIEFDQSKCWFCLASPAVQKHLIVSVGNFVYLTLAKGGIVEEHFLICPIEHLRCSLSLTDEVLSEIRKFKEAVRKFYRRRDEVPVFFERNYKSSHMQIQCVPVPKSVQTNLSNQFAVEAECLGLSLEKIGSGESPDQVLGKGSLYFLVEMPSGQDFYIKINSGTNFPVNFGRQVLASASILNKQNRVEWKDCLLEKEDEQELVKRIRTDFISYDVTE